MLTYSEYNSKDLVPCSSSSLSVSPPLTPVQNNIPETSLNDIKPHKKKCTKKKHDHYNDNALHSDTNVNDVETSSTTTTTTNCSVSTEFGSQVISEANQTSVHFEITQKGLKIVSDKESFL